MGGTFHISQRQARAPRIMFGWNIQKNHFSAAQWLWSRSCEHPPPSLRDLGNRAWSFKWVQELQPWDCSDCPCLPGQASPFATFRALQWGLQRTEQNSWEEWSSQRVRTIVDPKTSIWFLSLVWSYLRCVTVIILVFCTDIFMAWKLFIKAGKWRLLWSVGV